MDVLSPFKFNGFTIYTQTLISLNDLVREFKITKINIHEEREKLPKLTYKMLEILLKIYELVPLKFDKSKSLIKESEFYPFFKSLEDHMFSNDLEFDFLTEGLENLTHKNKHFFLYNFFARNVLEHHKHNIRCMGEGTVNENITSLNYRLSIVKGTSWWYDYLNKTFENESQIMKGKIRIEPSHNVYYLWMHIDIRFISDLVNNINRLFLNGYEIILQYLDSSKEKKVNGFPKANYINVINYWINELNESILKSDNY
jgi:hypothetical protein